MRLRTWYWRRLGVQIGHPSWIRCVRIDRNPWDIQIGNDVSLDDEVVLLTTGPRRTEARIRIHDSVYVNRFTMFDASESITVGPHTMIGPYCYITDHDHGNNAGMTLGKQPLVSAPVTLGENVWLGTGVIVLKGVTIGDGAVVGAGAVVTNDVRPNTTVAGVPAIPLSTAADAAHYRR